tara:strand:+ start:608 stop:919 length:312 start_codon:yes stop_codon:yes gene_type:complete
MPDEEKTKSAETTTATAPSSDAIVSSGLAVGDLQNLSMIIDICSRRGAFKAEELSIVGNVYTKLKTFLDSLPKPEGEPDKLKDAPATKMPADAPKVSDEGEIK